MRKNILLPPVSLFQYVQVGGWHPDYNMSFHYKSENQNICHNQSHASLPSEPFNHRKKKTQLLSIPLIFLAFTFLLNVFLFIYEYVQNSQVYTVAIIGTNDLHGKIFPTVLFRNDTKQLYKYGGSVFMASMMQTIRQQYQGNVLYLDAGDQFQGGIQASKLISNGQIMNDFFKMVGLSGSSIGNHEFDLGPQFLVRYFKDRATPNLAANLQSQKEEFDFLPNQKGSYLYTLPNGIRIGVIGLLTLQTQTTTAGFSSHKFPPYRILPYKQAVIKHSNELKSQGANAILIVSHMGDFCVSSVSYAIRTEISEQQDKQQCSIDQLSRLIDQLPKGTINGVIQGHRHKIAHRYYRGIPYMGSINGGYYFNVMYLKFNKRKELINSMIEGPIAVCQKIFQNRKRCDYVPEQELEQAGKLINWQFHKRFVVAHPQLQSLLETKYTFKMKPYMQHLIFSEVHLYPKQFEQSQLSNLFTTLMHEATPGTDFALINTGAFRTEWTPGVIQYQHFYNMFPFQNTLQRFEVTGKELKKMMQIVQESGRRFIQAYGLHMQIDIDNQNEDRILYKLASIKLSDGREIQEQKIYKGSTLSYLLQGGDSFNKLKIHGIQFKNVQTIGDFREVIKPLLMKMKTIKRENVMGKEKPRLIIRYNNK